MDPRNNVIEKAKEPLHALEAEKPADDARETARAIILSGYEFLNGLGGNKDEKILSNATEMIESYHAKKCAECSMNWNTARVDPPEESGRYFVLLIGANGTYPTVAQYYAHDKKWEYPNVGFWMNVPELEEK